MKLPQWAGEELVPDLDNVIDLHTLTPRQRRGCDFVGKWIGIGACYVIAGAWWTGRGVAWLVRAGMAARRPKEDG